MAKATHPHSSADAEGEHAAHHRSLAEAESEHEKLVVAEKDALEAFAQAQARVVESAAALAEMRAAAEP